MEKKTNIKKRGKKAEAYEPRVTHEFKLAIFFL
jgi:hypothetical protein